MDQSITSPPSRNRRRLGQPGRQPVAIAEPERRPEPDQPAAMRKKSGKIAARAMNAPVASAPMVRVSTRRSLRWKMQLASMAVAMVASPLFVAWFIADRPGIGPVVLGIKPGHGIHAVDLLVLAVFTPIWLRIVGQFGHLWRRRRGRRSVWVAAET